MIRADLLARIRKCMTLASSANEHEAAAALATAHRLMAEHGVDAVEMAMADVGEDRARGTGARRPPQWEATLVHAVMRAITVDAVYVAGGIKFVGLTPAPEVAVYAFTALHRQCKRARTDYSRTQLKRCGPTRKRSRADAFCEGWAAAVWRAVAAIAPDEPLAPIVRQYLAERHQHLTTIETRSGAGGQVGWNDRARGREAGADVRLHHGVAGSAPLRIGGAA